LALRRTRKSSQGGKRLALWVLDIEQIQLALARLSASGLTITAYKNRVENPAGVACRPFGFAVKKTELPLSKPQFYNLIICANKMNKIYHAVRF